MSGPTVRAPLLSPVTLNKFAVGATVDGRIVALNLPLHAGGLEGAAAVDPQGDAVAPALPRWPALAPLSPEEALNLAAWLVATSGRRREFLALLDAVEQT